MNSAIKNSNEGNEVRDFVKRNELIVFVLFAYAFSWICWSPIIHVVKADLFSSPGHAIALVFLGGYGPTLSALLVRALSGGWDDVKILLRKLLQWRVGFIWYAALLLAWPVIFATGAALYANAGGTFGSVNYGLLPWIPAIYLASIFLGPLAEELGWRGFALPILFDKYGFAGASAAIGVIWALWHAPLFWAATGTAVSGLEVSLANVSLFVLWTVGASLIYTWLFKNTRGSVLMAVLLHLSTNASGTVINMLFPDISVADKQLMYYYTLGALWSMLLLSAGAAYAMRRKRSPVLVM